MITHTFMDRQLQFTPTPQATALIQEIFSDNYKVAASHLSLPPDSVILDLGANEGMFSIYASLLFPQSRILAFEPVPRTFDVLTANLSLNHITNVEPYNIGIGKPNLSSAAIIVGKGGYSGGSSFWITYKESDHEKVTVPLLSLDDVFEIYNVSQCSLLKCDTEGAEYDIFYNCTHWDRIDAVTLEAHINARLDYESRRVDGLINWLSSRTRVLHVEVCRMAE